MVYAHPSCNMPHRPAPNKQPLALLTSLRFILQHTLVRQDMVPTCLSHAMCFRSLRKALKPFQKGREGVRPYSGVCHRILGGECEGYKLVDDIVQLHHAYAPIYSQCKRLFRLCLLARRVLWLISVIACFLAFFLQVVYFEAIPKQPGKLPEGKTLAVAVPYVPQEATQAFF